MDANDKVKGKKLREDVKKILEDIKELNRDIGEAGEEIEDTGEDVDQIKENVDSLLKEFDETGEDVEEIKEDIEEIKEDIGTMHKVLLKGKKIATKVIPDRFASKDIAQQIVGATILSAPFSVTEEVWNLARDLNATHIVFIVLITVLFDVLLFYYTRYQKTEEKKFLEFPKRIISIILVTYITSAIVLTVFGVIGGRIQDNLWAIKLIVMVGLFANIGAGTADLIK